MVKFIEAVTTLNEKILIRIDSIQSIEHRIDGCKINDKITIKMDFDEVRKIIEEYDNASPSNCKQGIDS